MPFPFSDLTNTKVRPALVLADLDGQDIVLCQVTSQIQYDENCVDINNSDFIARGLRQASFVRTNKLFTATKKSILNIEGKIDAKKQAEVVKQIIRLISYVQITISPNCISAYIMDVKCSDWMILFSLIICFNSSSETNITSNSSSSSNAWVCVNSQPVAKKL